MILLRGVRRIILLRWPKDINLAQRQANQEGLFASLLIIVACRLFTACKDKIGIVQQRCSNLDTRLHDMLQG